MIAATPGFDGFHGAALAALVAAIVGAVLWTAYLVAIWARRLRLPDAGPETTDLGSEPPAVAGLLVSGWRVAPTAVPATLLDLAARRVVGLEEVGPDRFVVRTRTGHANGSLTVYEEQVLRLVEARATGGSAPVEALTIESGDGAWRGDFAAAVARDARDRGLIVRGWPRATAVGLAAGLAGILGLLAWSLQLAHVALDRTQHGGGAWFAFGGVAWILAIGYGARVRTAWPTAAGRVACAHWLGVEERLRHQDGFADQPPAAVVVWDRLLAYGVALGVARAAAVALPIGPGDPAWAWSRETGEWRHVRIRYPKQGGAGGRAGQVLLGGIGRLLFWGVIGFVVLPVVVEIVWRVAHDVRTDGGLALIALVALFVAVPTVIGIYVAVRLVDGALRVWRGGFDLWHTASTEGTVVKVHGGCIAVDDGHATVLEALPVGTRPVPHLGDRIRVTFTPKLHHVETITTGGAP